jgi:hypothetical protein
VPWTNGQLLVGQLEEVKREGIVNYLVTLPMLDPVALSNCDRTQPRHVIMELDILIRPRVGRL